MLRAIIPVLSDHGARRVRVSNRLVPRTTGICERGVGIIDYNAVNRRVGRPDLCLDEDEVEIELSLSSVGYMDVVRCVYFEAGLRVQKTLVERRRCLVCAKGRRK